MNLFTKTSPSVVFALWELTSCAYSAQGAAAFAAAASARVVEYGSSLLALVAVGLTFVVSPLDTYTPFLGHLQSEQSPHFPPAGSVVYFLMP